ncbi:hypothetical protein F5141DRAFT_1061731 [Pisolithus sp. B1]|nr:hypothetical protein F5141DRAFT_1061731 [Pisolithus sp. B1]
MYSHIWFSIGLEHHKFHIADAGGGYFPLWGWSTGFLVVTEDSCAVTGHASEVYTKALMRRLVVIWGEVTNDGCVVTGFASVGLRGTGGGDSCIVTRHGWGTCTEASCIVTGHLPDRESTITRHASVGMWWGADDSCVVTRRGVECMHQGQVHSYQSYWMYGGWGTHTEASCIVTGCVSVGVRWGMDDSCVVTRHLLDMQARPCGVDGSTGVEALGNYEGQWIHQLLSAVHSLVDWDEMCSAIYCVNMNDGSVSDVAP